MRGIKFAKGKVIENRDDWVAHDCHIRLKKRFESKKKQRIKRQEKEKDQKAKAKRKRKSEK